MTSPSPSSTVAITVGPNGRKLAMLCLGRGFANDHPSRQATEMPSAQLRRPHGSAGEADLDLRVRSRRDGAERSAYRAPAEPSTTSSPTCTAPRRGQGARAVSPSGPVARMAMSPTTTQAATRSESQASSSLDVRTPDRRSRRRVSGAPRLEEPRTRRLGGRGSSGGAAPLAAWGHSARGRHRHRRPGDCEAAVGLAAGFLTQSADDARGRARPPRREPRRRHEEIESTLEAIRG